MESNGQIKKLWIQAYNSADMAKKDFVGEFYALVNPENYSIDLKMEAKGGQGQGTSSKQVKFSFKQPEEFTFEFLFDNTGIIDGKPLKDGIHEKLQELQDLVFKLDGKVHEPRHVHVIWGKLDFKGRVTGMTISYKLFKADGTPIRASVKVTIKKSIPEKEANAGDRKQSPDLTHRRILKQGESLPWLCDIIYGDPKYYIQVAKANRIANFRNIPVGTEIYFPPFTKSEA
ncbi:MAG TPA: LysM peptidoglycan-binding domain-containing protein [Ohtaekwangia sp.]|uniref:CIS tube protein n=1 Tax=Ohtaekwangia sp. TaxID=2066019 RepID=UPI002F92356E